MELQEGGQAVSSEVVLDQQGLLGVSAAPVELRQHPLAGEQHQQPLTAPAGHVNSVRQPPESTTAHFTTILISSSCTFACN